MIKLNLFGNIILDWKLFHLDLLISSGNFFDFFLIKNLLLQDRKCVSKFTNFASFKLLNSSKKFSFPKI